MKTVILAGIDNLVFQATDMLNPAEYKLIGYATTIEEAWNVYDENGNLIESVEQLPIMPLAAAVEFEPDAIILAAGNRDDEENLRFMLFRINYKGEVISLYDFFKGFSFKTAAIRKLAWRLDELGVPGAIADLGCNRGDISWQMNAMMPERKLYLFDTFTGYDERDIAVEKENGYSSANIGDYRLSSRENEVLEMRILGRMPYPDMVEIRKGWFPETAYNLEDEQYAMVHIDARLYNPTYSGIQYFFSRMSKGGVIILSNYEDGTSCGVKDAVADLEARYGAFLMVPLCDLSGSVVIIRP